MAASRATASNTATRMIIDYCSRASARLRSKYPRGGGGRENTRQLADGGRRVFLYYFLLPPWKTQVFTLFSPSSLEDTSARSWIMRKEQYVNQTVFYMYPTETNPRPGNKILNSPFYARCLSPLWDGMRTMPVTDAAHAAHRKVENLDILLGNGPGTVWRTVRDMEGAYARVPTGCEYFVKTKCATAVPGTWFNHSVVQPVVQQLHSIFDTLQEWRRWQLVTTVPTAVLSWTNGERLYGARQEQDELISYSNNDLLSCDSCIRNVQGTGPTGILPYNLPCWKTEMSIF